MRFLSVCSGIEAASVAWKPLGWECVGVSEIEAFPNAVLKHHYPDVRNFGDFTKIEPEDVGGVGTVELIVGGTPCQDFSVAGLRAGLNGARGQLSVEFCRLVGRLRPRWVVWENVPGVLSADDGNAFGLFLGALEDVGYGIAYRVLDAQHFGIPQRRRRVFVVGHSRAEWQRSAAVLFERESLSGNPPPSRETEEDIAGTLGAVTGSFRTTDLDGVGAYVGVGSGEGLPPAKSRAAITGGRPSIGFIVANTLVAYKGRNQIEATYVPDGDRVRRLTPLEWERLQGFPDRYTDIEWRGKPAPDGHRYKALGNSMAVPVMRWIGERIELVERLVAERAS